MFCFEIPPSPVKLAQKNSPPLKDTNRIKWNSNLPGPIVLFKTSMQLLNFLENLRRSFIL